MLLFFLSMTIGGLRLLRAVKSNTSILSLHLPSELIRGITADLTGSYTLPKGMFLTRTFYSLDFLWPENRWARRDFLLTGSEPDIRIPFEAPARGYYKILPALIIKDPLSFFIFQIPLIASEPRAVIDNPAGEQDLREPRISLSKIQTQKKDTDEELFEIRPYFPGDDPRKLNWKLMAHSGDLFIRQGEDGTPFLSKIYCILNTEIQGIPRETQLLWSDVIVREFHSLLLELQQKPLEIHIALPGMKNFKLLNQINNLDEKLAASASRELSLRPQQIKDGPVLIISYTYSDSLVAWLKNSSARDLTLMMKKPPFEDNTSKSILTRISEILFQDTEKKKEGELSKRKLRILQKNYQSKLDSFSEEGGRYVISI